MSSVTIDYDKLSTISKNATSAASRMNDYINDLTKKVTGKYSGITGGATSKTQSSEYYVNQKISQLRTKKDQYTSFSTAVNSLSTKAQEIDRDVAKKIKASKDQFVDKHDYISTDWWTDIKNWFIDLKNSCPLFNAIGQLIENTITGLKNLWADLKYWYKCGGGKECVGKWLAIAGAIAATVIAICALWTPISGIVAVCALIGAVITATNAWYNVRTSLQAEKAKKDGDPAWAKIYGDRDTLQDGLRQTNFGDGTLNRLSYGAATTIDVVQTVCDIVAIYDGIKNIRNVYKEIKISAQKGNISFGTRLKQYLFNSDSYMKDSKDKALKWRDILQKRGKIRTLRGYGATKALSIDQYNKSLTNAQKIAGKISTYAKHGSNFVKYSQKFFDYTLGGDASWKEIGKDALKGVSKKFILPDTISKLYDLKDKNWKSFKNDYNGFRGLEGLAG